VDRSSGFLNRIMVLHDQVNGSGGAGPNRIGCLGLGRLVPLI